MTITWFRVLARITGLATCALILVVAAQWLSLSFGWTPLVDLHTVNSRTDRFSSALREGPSILLAAGLVIVGVVLFAAWLLAGRRTRDDRTMRVGARRRMFRIDRDSLAASLERRLEPLDRRVDVAVRVTRRGRVDLRLITPDTSATGPTAEHVRVLADVLDERHLPCHIGSVDVVDVRKLKSRHRVR